MSSETAINALFMYKTGPAMAFEAKRIKISVMMIFIS
jgi:hypothetical protein